MKKSRVLTAGAAAMVFSSVVGSAAFLTLNSPRADFLPDTSIWQNSLLPGMADSDSRYHRTNERSGSDFLNMDFASYGDAFTSGGAAGDADQLAALNSIDNGSNGNGSGNGGTSGSSGGNGDSTGAARGPGSSAPQTFSATPSAWDAVRSELERSIEPPAGRGNGDGDDELAEFNPDETMTPDPTETLPPVDQQPLPERQVPEPQSLALLLLGLAGLRALRYRRSA